jgi:leucyl aminopeptidase
VPWVHLDIAGPARAAETEHYILKGGTGYGVRTMVALAETMAEA